ncbi:MAG: stress response translation initiation inhibitor YciH [Halobacteriota archaeon]|nr:stress response translation initiation inhibitor YciH [Halobacteriota archaeon]
MAVCDKCGLPDDLCVCEEIVKESQRVKITTARRRFGKLMTIVEGIDDPNIDLRDLTKKLKAKCACGGTVKDGHIELQGDHAEKIKKILMEMGYSVYGDNP